jgi:hypothetical protein
VVKRVGIYTSPCQRCIARRRKVGEVGPLGGTLRLWRLRVHMRASLPGGEGRKRNGGREAGRENVRAIACMSSDL